MTITAAMVKELRERTGSGMMECKKALVAAGGDIEQAVEDMRKAGQAKADKKASRTAAEGVIFVKVSDDNKQAVMLEVNSETDFVARDENFLGFVNKVAEVALTNNVSDIENLLTQTTSEGISIDETRRNLIAKIGENVNLRRMVNVKASSDNAQVGCYVHGGRIGVVIEIENGVTQLAKDLAMHIAACNPMVVNPSDVSDEIVEKEKEIFTAQASQSGKPAEIIEKMISGRINKFLDEVSLVGQPYVKDPNTTVGKLLKAENASVVKFVRYEVGEGIEKKEEDFAAEVMAQVKGS